MLYDPKWEVKADPFSLASLIAWLEKQPADGAYCYENPRSCLLGKWIHDITGLKDSGLGDRSLDFGIQNPAIARIAYPSSPKRDFIYTFGAALDRARAASSATVMGP